MRRAPFLTMAAFAAALTCHSFRHFLWRAPKTQGVVAVVNDIPITERDFTQRSSHFSPY